MKKVNYDNIKWEKEGRLYRGTSQWKFELSVLTSIVKAGYPFYKGCIERGKGITWTSPSSLNAVIYIEMRNPERYDYFVSQKKDEKWPFTNHPIIIEINAKNLKDRLVSNGDGIAIEGPIDIEDTKIIFSSQIDRLDELESPEYLKEAHRIDLSNEVQRYGFNGKDLFDYWEEDPEIEKGLNYFCTGITIDDCAVERNKVIVRKFIEIMRKKMVPQLC